MSYFRLTVLAFALPLFAFGCGDDDRPMTGACMPACTPGNLCCEARCANVQTDFANCGACGRSCAAGQMCTAGACTGDPVDGGGVDAPRVDTGLSMCTPTCSSSTQCCGSACVNREGPMGVLDARTDPSFQNCNGCGLACDTDRASRCGTQLGMGGPPQCLCGNNLQCPPGQGCVANESGLFICADFNFDRNNCGGVGIMCGEGESCSSGVCGCGAAGPCADDSACCGGACIDTSTDTMNCGGCGTVCGTEAPTCTGGTCGCGTGGACRAPVAGMLGMGGDPGQSCCGATCTENTTASCACSACTGDDECQVAGDLLGMGGGAVEVCCGGPEVALLGCGGFGLGDGGLPFP